MPYDPEKFKKAIASNLSSQGVPPGKTEGQPTIEDQINAARTQELAARAKEQSQAGQFSTPLNQLGAGVKEGLKRQDAPPDAPGMERLGQKVGRYGPIGAAALAAPLIGPETLLGSPALGSAASQFLSVGGGEAASQALSKAMGGNAPTLGQGISSSVKTGLGAAAMDLGLTGVAKVISSIPEIASTFLKIPSESLKRAIKNPDIIPEGGPAALLKTEGKAAGLVKGLQNDLEAYRNKLGMDVDKALDKLHVKTKGAKVFDVAPLADDIKSFMHNELQSSDPSVKALVGDDNKKILAFVKTLENSPKKTAQAMVQIKRELQSLGDYSQAGVPKIQSDAGQRVYKRLAHNFREVIDGAGKILNDTNLTQANQAAHDFFNKYDELRPWLGTKDQGIDALKSRLVSLEGKFNAGGLSQFQIENIKNILPGSEKRVNDLMDALAARSYTKHAIGTPSGTAKDLLRIIANPQNIGRVIKASKSKPGKAIASATGPSLNSIAAMLSSSAAQPYNGMPK